MAVNRNSNPINTGGISIRPATPNNFSQNSSTDMLVQPSISSLDYTQGISNPSITSANQAGSDQSFSFGNVPTISFLSPLVALTGNPNPFILPPLIFTPKINIVKRITERDYLEETLNLDTYSFSENNPVLDTSKIRCDIISLIPFRSIYQNPTLQQSPNILSTFGHYFQDLYQSSIVRDTTRKYLIVNGLGPQYNTATGREFTNGALSNILASISYGLNSNIFQSEEIVGTLDNLIARINEINSCLDVKENLGASGFSSFAAPYMDIRQFFISRMLFNDVSFNVFSDTKVAYQLLSDLNGILRKCSFNLIEGFTDHDRSTYVSNPLKISKQTAQDAITIDSTYGDKLTYDTKTIQLRYVTNTANMNGLLSSLPNGSANRLKFIINLLSRECKVSKALGKYSRELSTDLSFFNIKDRGNPFDNILGVVPSDIFLEPAGQNSLAAMFYVKTGNAVVLPFENRQVVGDNETIFIPGATYFCDSIFKGDLSIYNSYKETFGTRVAKATEIFNRFLLNQTDYDATSSPLEPLSLLKNILSRYKLSADFIRKNNNEATALLTFILLLISNNDANLKFEVFKLLLFIIIYDSRPEVTNKVAQTDYFRDLLLSEISQQNVQGVTDQINEDNIPNILSTQIEIVKNLIIKSILNLSINTKDFNGLQKNKSKEVSIENIKKKYGIKTSLKSDLSLKSMSENSVSVQLQQFSRLQESLRGEENLLKNIADIAKDLFSACSEKDVSYHLLENGSTTRFNGLTLTGTLFFIFEIFNSLVDQFARPSLAYNLIDGAGGKDKSNKYILISYTGNDLGEISNAIDQYIKNSPYENSIIKDYDAKLSDEKNIIDNILVYFNRLNQRLNSVTSLSNTEKESLAKLNAINPITLGSTRTSKSILKSFVDKKTIYNPTNNPSSNFYMPSGKVLTQKNYEALKIALKNPIFTSGRRRSLVVGIPRDFTKTALSAQLKKDDTYQGNLQTQTTDIVQISIHKIDKENEGIIYKPQTFKFDLSLFPRGFDSFDIDLIKSWSYSDLLDNFEFYDFDEDIPYSMVSPSRIGGSQNFLTTDLFYKISGERKALGLEVIRNLQQSYLLDLYNHIITGLNYGEENFIEYTQEETSGFINAMKSLSTQNPNFVGLKFMTPEYSDLLKYYSANSDDLKLMLTLCNDVQKSVFRQKMYDRVFTVSFDVDKFEIDENEMMQTDETRNYLTVLRNKDKLLISEQSNVRQTTDEVSYATASYKKPNEFILDQYFIEVELVQ